MSLLCHSNTGVDVFEESSFRPIDAIGNASSQSSDPSAKAANNLVLSTGSVVPLNSLSDSDLLDEVIPVSLLSS